MRLNILFDANFMLSRNLYLLLRESRSSNFLSKEEDRITFEKKTMDDVRHVINMFSRSSINNCIWCIDSKSWRKDLIDDSYKAGRKKDEDDDVDWESYRLVCDSVKKTLADCGVTISKMDKAEADDLVFLWSNLFYERGESVLIVSGDKDMRQLVKTASGESVVSLYNPLAKSRTFTFASGSSDEEERDEFDDLFDRRSASSIEQLMAVALKNEVSYVNPEWELLLKILTGDKSDNIPAIIRWKSTSGERTFSLTERMVNNAGINVDSFPKVCDLIEDHNLLRMFCRKLIDSSGSADFSEDAAVENFRNNTKIIWLNESTIPEEIRISVEQLSSERFDVTERMVESLRPELKAEQTKQKGIQSDIFSMFS